MLITLTRSHDWFTMIIQSKKMLKLFLKIPLGMPQLKLMRMTDLLILKLNLLIICCNLAAMLTNPFLVFL